MNSIIKILLLAAVTTGLIVGCSGSGGSGNPLSPTIDPNGGPSATTIFSNYNASAHQGIAGLNFSGSSGMTPGFLYNMNSAIVLARYSASQVVNVPGAEPSGYDGTWYVSTDSVVAGTIATVKVKWTPNPFRSTGSVVPNQFDEQMTESYTNSGITTAVTVSVSTSKQFDGSYSGTWNDIIGLSFVSTYLPHIQIQSPTTWTNLNNNMSNGLYVSPAGSFHALGSAVLGIDSTTGLRNLYYYEGYWVVPTNVATNDSIGYLKVGGQLFASYFYTGFDNILGIYSGNYRLAGSSDHSLHSFSMVSN